MIEISSNPDPQPEDTDGNNDGAPEDAGPGDLPFASEGGEAACWLPWVCTECGAMRENPETNRCWRCGAAVAERE
jgi:hypothetical protein